MEEDGQKREQDLNILGLQYARYNRENNIAQAANVLNQMLFIFGQDERKEQVILLTLKDETEARIDLYIEHYLPVFERHYSVGCFKHMLPQNLKEIGVAYCQAGAVEKSKKFLQRAKILFEKIFGANHFYVSEACIMLSEVCRKLGEWPESLNFLKEGSALLELCVSDEPVAQEYKTIYRETYHDTAAAVIAETGLQYHSYYGEGHKAILLLEYALRLYESEDKPYYERRIAILGELIGIYRSLEVYKDLKEVKKLYIVMKKLASIYKEMNLSEIPQRGNLLADLGRICCGWEKFAKAKNYLEGSRRILEKCGEDHHQQLTEVLEDLEEVNSALAAKAHRKKKPVSSLGFFPTVEQVAEERKDASGENKDKPSESQSPRAK